MSENNKVKLNLFKLITGEISEVIGYVGRRSIELGKDVFVFLGITTLLHTYNPIKFVTYVIYFCMLVHILTKWMLRIVNTFRGKYILRYRY